MCVYVCVCVCGVRACVYLCLAVAGQCYVYNVDVGVAVLVDVWVLFCFSKMTFSTKNLGLRLDDSFLVSLHDQGRVFEQGFDNSSFEVWWYRIRSQ